MFPQCITEACLALERLHSHALLEGTAITVGSQGTAILVEGREEQLKVKHRLLAWKECGFMPERQG